MYVVGIDEVGRGPLAGPVAVGVVLAPVDFDWHVLPGVTDSKQLSEQKREEIANQAKTLMRQGRLHYYVCTTSAPIIDRIGIVSAIDRALVRGLENVCQCGTAEPCETLVKLDGGLRAPATWPWQETIIKGDSKEPVIGLASIVAKVARDRYMCRLATRAGYTPYDFAAHKGYGTQAHRAAIAQHGLSPQHRRSYCRNIELL